MNEPNVTDEMLALLARFWRKVALPEPWDDAACWQWVGAISRYGRIKIGGQMALAHRYSYEHFVGPIPAGLQIDHLCRNRECVNPSHLEAVDQRTNVLRGVGACANNARKAHCKNGHAFAEFGAVVDGRRRCLTCYRDAARVRSRKWHADPKNKAARRASYAARGAT